MQFESMLLIVALINDVVMLSKNGVKDLY